MFIRKNDFSSSLHGMPSRQSGVVLLIFLAIITVAFAASLLTRLSINDYRAAKQAGDLQVIRQAREALLGYALRDSVNGADKPVGRLPCPDVDGDGNEDIVANACQMNRGFLPFLTINSGELQDSSGARLWYAVELNYADPAVAASNINSSSTVQLSLDAENVAAIIIAPGVALGNQQRNDNVVGNYLEGLNAAAPVWQFENNVSDTNNDTAIGVPLYSYWQLMERRVADLTEALLVGYKACTGEYPWAANFAATASVNGLKQGMVPYGTALPDNWGTGCVPAMTEWLNNNWSGSVHYGMCLVADGNCFQVAGQDEEAVIILPGTRLTALGQNRAGMPAVSDYFENDNADGDTSYEKRKAENMDGNFNDWLYVIGP